MNIKLKFKKNILIGLLVAFIPASLNAAWYHNVATSFKENLVAIASVAVGGTALLGTLWYMRNRAQNKEPIKPAPLKKTAVKDDRSTLQAKLQEANEKIAFLQGEQRVLHAANQRLSNSQSLGHAVPTVPAACTNCAGHETTIQRWKATLHGVIGERDKLQKQLAQAQQAPQHQSILDRWKQSAQSTETRLRNERNTAQQTLAVRDAEISRLQFDNHKATQAMNDAKRKAQADIDPLLAKIAGLEKIQATQDRELNATKAALKTANEKFTQQGAAYQRTIAQLTQLQNAELKLYEERAAKRTADLQANHNALTQKYNALLSSVMKTPLL